MAQSIKKPLTAALGAAFLASALAPAAQADSNPFAAQNLNAGYDINAGKHAEGKCGEGKCGGKKATKEGKCGEGKCGGEKAVKEGKCGGKKAAKEGKCGGEK